MVIGSIYKELYGKVRFNFQTTDYDSMNSKNNNTTGKKYREELLRPGRLWLATAIKRSRVMPVFFPSLIYVAQRLQIFAR